VCWDLGVVELEFDCFGKLFLCSECVGEDETEGEFGVFVVGLGKFLCVCCCLVGSNVFVQFDLGYDGVGEY